MTATALNYISKQQLANSLGVSIATINRKLKEIPHLKMGNTRQSRVLFSIEKVSNYLNDRSTKPHGSQVKLAT
jgi:hypothetical protein